MGVESLNSHRCNTAVPLESDNHHAVVSCARLVIDIKCEIRRRVLMLIRLLTSPLKPRSYRTRRVALTRQRSRKFDFVATLRDALGVNAHYRGFTQSSHDITPNSDNKHILDIHPTCLLCSQIQQNLRTESKNNASACTALEQTHS